MNWKDLVKVRSPQKCLACKPALREVLSRTSPFSRMKVARDSSAVMFERRVRPARIAVVILLLVSIGIVPALVRSKAQSPGNSRPRRVAQTTENNDPKLPANIAGEMVRYPGPEIAFI